MKAENKFLLRSMLHSTPAAKVLFLNHVSGHISPLEGWKPSNAMVSNQILIRTHRGL